MDQENTDRLLFNRIADKYAIKDITQSSQIARRYWVQYLLHLCLNYKVTLGNVLEIGCGIGAPAKYLDGYYEKYVGIDQSEILIEKAREYNRGNLKAEFKCINVKEIAQQQNIYQTIDTVLSIGALHHMTALDEVFVTLKKITKSGDYLIISEPYRSNFLLQGLRFLRTLVDKNYSRDQKFFSENELRELLTKYNLKIKKITYQGFFSPPFAQVIIKPQFIAVPMSRLAVGMDKFLDKYVAKFLKKISWNINIIAQFN
ncbi:MAG TPA: class I SAM-dependent methyltransferase [bacterium]|nr:class I SAM-dependent methyltransferase [bacterium]